MQNQSLQNMDSKVHEAYSKAFEFIHNMKGKTHNREDSCRFFVAETFME
jgi:hypothetical protein